MDEAEMATNAPGTHRPVSAALSRNPLPLVRRSSVDPFFAFCDSVGVPTTRLCQRAQLPHSELQRPDGLLSLHSCYRFLDAVIQSEDLPELGLLVAQRSSPFELGHFGALLRRSATLAEYLLNGARYVSTYSNTGIRVGLTPEEDLLRVSFTVTDAPGLGPATVDLHTLMLTLGVLREVIGDHWEPKEIRLRSGSDRLLQRIELPLNSSLIVGADRTSFTLARKLLRRPLGIVTTRERGSGSVQSGKSSAIQSLPETFPASVDLLLQGMLDEGSADLSSLAEACGMSTRGLQRYLAANGTSFRERLAACRLRRARQRLATSDVPIAEIAAELGYSDASNFSRAFYRELGQSPMSFRHAVLLCSKQGGVGG